MENLSIKDLKELAYDKIGQIDQYNAAIEHVRQQLAGINQQIRQKHMEEEIVKKLQAAAKKSEEVPNLTDIPNLTSIPKS